jgi:hypothetical protein
MCVKAGTADLRRSYDKHAQLSKTISNSKFNNPLHSLYLRNNCKSMHFKTILWINKPSRCIAINKYSVRFDGKFTYARRPQPGVGSYVTIWRFCYEWFDLNQDDDVILSQPRFARSVRMQIL